MSGTGVELRGTDLESVCSPRRTPFESRENSSGRWHRTPVSQLLTQKGCSEGVEPVSSTVTKSRAEPLHYEQQIEHFLFSIKRKKRESNSQGTRERTRPASNRLPSPIGLPFRSPQQAASLFSSPTRIRTWNTSLEARDDVRFTIEPFHEAEGMGFEPTFPEGHSH